LGTIHFRDRPLRQVSCYTLPSGFQLSWPPPCYLEQTIPFVVSENELALGHTCVCYRSIPHRQYCLPVLAHTEPRHSDMIRRSNVPAGSPSSHAPLCSFPLGRTEKGSQPPVKAATRVHTVPPSQFDDRSRGRSLPEFPLVRCSTSQNFSGLLSSPNTQTTTAPAILRETSRQTSYQMVRWVFRPYTQLRRTICTSVLRPASTTLSHGFAVAGNSSPPFGSRHRVLSLKTMSYD